jgi:uncharacterized coiled-coil protein SlyX
MSHKIINDPICINLLNSVKDLYKIKFKDKKKVPKTLNKLSKDFLIKFPTNFFFKAIEIKSFEEDADKDLDNCFPDNFFPDDNDEFIYKIFEFLYQNIKNFEKNDIIIKGLKGIINSLKSGSLIKKYINLIDIAIKDLDDENKLLCELLASNPFKYKELVFLVDTNIKVSPLPKTAVDFYSLNNYKNNIEKFSKFTAPIDNLKKEVLAMIESQNDKLSSQEKEINKLKGELSSQAQTIGDLNSKLTSQTQTIGDLKKEISDLKKDSNIVKFALFQVQIRDVIKAFVTNIFWSLHIKKNIDDVPEVKNDLIAISGSQNDGVNAIVNLLNNLKNLKKSGDDQGHYVNNIGFDETILPEEVRQKYEKLKGSANCGIKDCDCIALILSIKEVNDSTIEMTKKKYNFFKRLIEIPVKDWEKNKEEVKKLLNSY